MKAKQSTKKGPKSAIIIPSLCLLKNMKTTLLPYLFLAFAAVVATSCNKTEDANCQSAKHWVDITLNGNAYNSLAPCAEWQVSIDSLSQTIDGEVINGFYFMQLSNQLSINRGDSSIGNLWFDLFFFAPENLLQTTINGTDTSRFMSPENICALLDSNYHRLGNSLEDTNAVVTNITFTNNAGNALESFYQVTNWQTSGYGFQPIEIEGDENGECITRFEMNALLSDSTQTDTIGLFGKVRMPFK